MIRINHGTKFRFTVLNKHYASDSLKVTTIYFSKNIESVSTNIILVHRKCFGLKITVLYWIIDVLTFSHLENFKNNQTGLLIKTPLSISVYSTCDLRQYQDHPHKIYIYQ